MEMQRIGNVRDVQIEDEMRTAYLDYAMSVIVARALPDVRDGLKPVHRRILYTMHEMGLRSTAAYRKCAGVVGEAMAKYHPHGDLALYETLVRLAQDFSLRYPLVDGQGNFGSIDGDPPAAMRYTEARMAAISDEMLADIEKETVDFVDNYDGRLRQPTVLPSRLPNLLVNGSSGIAVGMATNIPPHNLGEVSRAIATLIDNPEATVDELCEIVTGPDFPTGGTIFRFEDQRNALTGERERVDVIRHMYATGRGRIIIRGQVAFEEVRSGKMAVVVTELPYQVNKTTLIERMAELVGSKKITDVSDIRDESDRDGMRIVVEVKRDGSPHTVMQQLFKHTALQTSFSANVLALVDGQPQTLGLKKLLEHYIAYRREVVRRRTEFDLARAQERAHILEGLKIALDNILFFTNRGRVFITKVHTLPDASRQAKGLPIINLPGVQVEQREYVSAIVSLPQFEPGHYLVMATRKGMIKKTSLEEYAKIRANGLIAINLVDGDELQWVGLSDGQNDIVVATRKGQAARFHETEVRPLGRGTQGVAAIRLRRDDEVIGMEVVQHADQQLLVVTEQGFGKRTDVADFPVKHRATGGVIANSLGPETGDVAAIRLVNREDEEVMLITELGTILRTEVGGINRYRRASRGVTVMKPATDDRIVSITVFVDDRALDELAPDEAS
jgi:DNA gyrase subunit A